MKHFPSTRQPARLEGLSEHITHVRSSHLSHVLVAIAALSAGIAIGLAIDGLRNLGGF